MESEEIDSFYFKETISGIEHDYRITQNEGYYGVEYDGEIIAELQLNDYEGWMQSAGVPLPQNLIEMIGQKIEDHYY